MGDIGFFRLSGRLKRVDLPRKTLTLHFFVKGPTEELLERQISLETPEEELYRIGREWMQDGAVLVSGILLPLPDNLALRVESLHLLRSAKPLFLNEALLWGKVKERLSDTVYLFTAQEDGEVTFPTESPLPLVVGRSYYLKGTISPRYYPRLDLWQNRFKAQEAEEILGTLAVKRGGGTRGAHL